MTAQPNFILANTPPTGNHAEPLWFVFREHRLLLRPTGASSAVPVAHQARELGPVGQPRHYLGELDGRPCYAAEWPADADLPAGWEEQSLRRLLNHLDDARFTMASRAIQLLRWYRNHRFCGRCGRATRIHERDHAMVCPACEHSQYPRITPCVIMLVTCGERALLARAAGFPEGFYSCLAGFMEAGETCEQAVQREVREETGLAVTDLRYYASQPWPFPHSLMLGFRAHHAGGDIRVDPNELHEAHWWHRHELPKVPPQGSIARALIDDWLHEQAG